MTKRKLTDVEQKIASKRIKGLKEETSDLRIEREVINLKIDKLLDWEVRKQKRSLKQRLNEIAELVNTNNVSVDVMSEHLKEGVEVNEDGK